MANEEIKPLRPRQRNFVHLIAFQGLTREEAYSQSHSFPLETDEDLNKARARATRLFYTPHVNRYYHACMEEVREKEIEKGVWTKQVATDKLLRLIEQAENDIYTENKQLTMSRMNAILLPAKELNLMNGFNQSNVNVTGCIVQITGEDEIPD